MGEEMYTPTSPAPNSYTNQYQDAITFLKINTWGYDNKPYTSQEITLCYTTILLWLSSVLLSPYDIPTVSPPSASSETDLQ